ncbi:MAG: riboflavin biosynthesis protein RibF [Spiroplasma poulsonii]|uniref:Riboflavin biosynthesis protein n=1 Tax=Spiroplasma poulsonii TaxID=2138 RepID=A0A2P6FDM3_9MOLU|nr:MULTISPECIES: riboflavin kinase [Spiroplasma]KAF0850546.1 Riboflavin biosynthesis protein RibF [Spiroplasma poulsonii]MBH8623261.1 riboflavin biosynthesis protein RibF [Spiroplasma sp. hyd1]MBW1242569.1 riboflavin biosynthesis protein RibF [Spiroplasma poulsonii]PQM31558.1 Riboflavin biosynthesis protein RibF [Spiroplasma poulsonii]PWF96574.1 Riboflavin biosynthesis protein RibF [Spiroplasma poulsonii]
MKILTWNKLANNEAKIVSLGLFDGFHLGHLKLINRLMEIKAEQNLAALFFTMSQSVTDFLHQTDTKLLDNRSKQETAAKLNFDYYLDVPVTSEFMNLSAQQFLTILKERFNVIKIVIGSDFRFGKNREGDFKQIITFFGQENVYLINRQDDVFSSTTIRNLLLNYDLPAANKLLYEDYHLCGKVKPGKQIGRTINFPTANMYLPQKVILPYGVYVTETWAQGHLYPSMTSYRLFEGKEVVETYLLDANLNLYEQEIIVYFKKYLRENIKINNLTELVNLLEQDLADTLAFFANKA